MIAYIHHNPQKHGFVSDFKDYPHSSFHSHLAKKATKLNRDEVLSWFGGELPCFDFHKNHKYLDAIKDWAIEFD